MESKTREDARHYKIETCQQDGFTGRRVYYRSGILDAITAIVNESGDWTLGLHANTMASAQKWIWADRARRKAYGKDISGDSVAGLTMMQHRIGDYQPDHQEARKRFSCIQCKGEGEEYITEPTGAEDARKGIPAVSTNLVRCAACEGTGYTSHGIDL